MEPDVIRIYSSSPPPMEDGVEDEDGDFGDFGAFSSVPTSISFSELDTPMTFDQNRALSATSPPELLGGRGVVANGVAASHERTEKRKLVDRNGGTEVLTNGFVTRDVQGSPAFMTSVHSSNQDGEDEFADFAAFSSEGQQVNQETSTGDDVRDLDGPGSHGPETDGPGTDGVDRPGTDGPGTDGPGTDGPGTHRPETDGPGTDGPGTDGPGTHRPETDGPGTDGPETDGPGTDGPGSHRPETDGPGIDGPGTDGVDGPGTDGPGTHRPETDGPGTDGPGIDGPETDGPGTDGVQTYESGTDGPETDGPGTDGPGTDGPGTDGPGIGSCCVPAEVSVSHNHSVERDASPPPPETVCTKAPPPETVCTKAPPPETVCTKAPPPPAHGGDDLSPDAGWDSEKGSETETETSLGRPLSTDALEEYGDMSTTGSAPSPPPQGGAGTPADEDDEDFGDFGDAGSFAGQGFADFHQDKVEDDNFGDFNSSKDRPEGAESASVAASDSFGNFSSGKSWAEFSTEARTEQAEEEWHEVVEETSRSDSQPAPPSSRLTQLFQISFPLTGVRLLEVQVDHLEVLLKPDRDLDRDEDQVEPKNRSSPVGVWTWLRDVHEALGLRYQWGGSHCNKALLGCLGIDTRNILFTGQKKQPIIVPMYAAGLGMLEPTKEPVKPISAAEMIASIAAPERSSCPAETVQETLPPVQFDWSSSGLTNPLDASGGSSLLNLDFFGPVEDSGSSSAASIPGVDPELFELTTTVLDTGVSGSRVADAFARLMSTMEKTSTSTRKPKRDENLSEEASKVITALPDLSFMQAKVLMFPATLMPLGTRATPD